jgi:hypothetical protein
MGGTSSNPRNNSIVPILRYKVNDVFNVNKINALIFKLSQLNSNGKNVLIDLFYHNDKMILN